MIAVKRESPEIPTELDAREASTGLPSDVDEVYNKDTATGHHPVLPFSPPVIVKVETEEAENLRYIGDIKPGKKLTKKDKGKGRKEASASPASARSGQHKGSTSASPHSHTQTYAQSIQKELATLKKELQNARTVRRCNT